MFSLRLCVGLILFDVALGDSVAQFPPVLPLAMGQTGTIGCNITTTDTNPDLFWYRQLENHPPEKLLHVAKYKASDVSAHGRLSAALDWDQRLVSLQVTHPGPEDDGAVYYCALRPDTNNLRVTFGAGTRLAVTPDILDSSPSVYLLKPATGRTAEVGPACLVTDFSPANNVAIFLNESTMGKRPATLVRSGQQWSYGVVEWSSKPNDEQFKCTAQYKGITYITQDCADDVVHINCTATSVTETFKTDEKLNTLSLAVLALKIIFLKSIAFNLLITVRLWIS